MAVQLNRRGVSHARTCISEARVVRDARDAWSEHQPSTKEENAFLASHGFRDYAKWHLGVDDQQPEDAKRRYKFPYGDFKKVHRCAVLSAESRAGQYKYFDIEAAAAKLHSLIDGVKEHPPIEATKRAPRTRAATRGLRQRRTTRRRAAVGQRT
jgi:hypothetical protein